MLFMSPQEKPHNGRTDEEKAGQRSPWRVLWVHSLSAQHSTGREPSGRAQKPCPWLTWDCEASGSSQQRPAKENREVDVLWNFYFKTIKAGVSGTDGDGLEDTQETDGSNRNTSANSFNIQKKFANKDRHNGD